MSEPHELEERARAELLKCAQPDGGLFDLGWYLAWSPGREDATLDGTFSAYDLRAIADFMLSHTAKETSNG